jgi:hypothetical protein
MATKKSYFNLFILVDGLNHPFSYNSLHHKLVINLLLHFYFATFYPAIDVVFNSGNSLVLFHEGKIWLVFRKFKLYSKVQSKTIIDDFIRFREKKIVEISSYYYRHIYKIKILDSADSFEFCADLQQWIVLYNTIFDYGVRSIFWG